MIDCFNIITTYKVSPADRALIGSATLVSDNDNGLSHESDLYPDNYGPVSSDEARIVVNDQLFFTATTGSDFAGANDLAVTVRLKCRIVKLSEREEKTRDRLMIDGYLAWGGCVGESNYGVL